MGVGDITLIKMCLLLSSFYVSGGKEKTPKIQIYNMLHGVSAWKKKKVGCREKEQ